MSLRRLPVQSLPKHQANLRAHVSLPTIHPEVTGRASGDDLEPLAVTIRRACELSGFGPVTIWKLGKERRIKLVRVRGVRRTLVDFSSLKKLLNPDPNDMLPRRRGRPKLPAKEVRA